MPESILLAYASRYGSTQEIAEAVTATLKEKGYSVDLKPAREVRSLDQYNAVILGAPLYMFRWHKDAKRFLKRHRKVITQRPVAVFALGPFDDVEKDWQDVQSQIDKELAKFPWFVPKAVEVMGGAFDPQKLRFPFRFIPALKYMPAKDIRDWDKIRAWAEDLPSLLNCE